MLTTFENHIQHWNHTECLTGKHDVPLNSWGFAAVISIEVRYQYMIPTGSRRRYFFTDGGRLSCWTPFWQRLDIAARIAHLARCCSVRGLLVHTANKEA